MNGNTVKAIRLFNDESQQSFARLLGFSSSGIAAVESGRYKPSVRLRAAIARRFPITDDFIHFLREFEKMNNFSQDNIDL